MHLGFSFFFFRLLEYLVRTSGIWYYLQLSQKEVEVSRFVCDIVIEDIRKFHALIATNNLEGFPSLESDVYMRMDMSV